MEELFICKVSYTDTVNDKPKKITEPFLVKAISLTDAEAKLTEEMAGFNQGEFSVETVNREKDVIEINTSDVEENSWYKTIINYITLDEVSGVEKRTKKVLYKHSDDVENVIKWLKEFMKGSMADYEVVTITKTKIIGYIGGEVKGDN